MVSFLIDAVLSVMLLTATGYLVVVNQRLKVLRNGQSEINALIGTFSRTIDDTDASMKRLVGSATEVSGLLAQDLDRAKAIKEDMSLILGSCERALARMEESTQHARALLRRLDEGAMQRPARRAQAEAAPAPTAAPPPTAARTPVAVATTPVAVAKEPPAAPPRPPVFLPSFDDSMGTSIQDILPEVIPDAAPDAAPGSIPGAAGGSDVGAGDGGVSDGGAGDGEEEGEPVLPDRRKPVGAFYARLRTIAPEA